MNLKVSKIKTYVGFAIKSKKICFGTDKIISNKNIKLVILSSELSENSRKKIDKYILKCGAKSVIIDGRELKEIVGTENMSAIGIIDENLSNAIIALLS